MFTIVAFPDTFASSTLDVAYGVLNQFNPILLLIFGVLLAVLATTFLIRVLTHH